ncbi:SOS-induced cell division inhibitor SulA [Stutzerimonas tarimensis]|uniref:SOS-induced cell division inhibitor SulA n=1 Tax=Stutzerimonas tarimensis TaxID=1507735 RepID=A0ABV7T1U9_9GAMM
MHHQPPAPETRRLPFAGLFAQQMLPFQPSVKSHARPLTNLSELSLSGDGGHCELLLASMLRPLSEATDSRWLTLIAPPAPICRQWLRENGLNCERILLIQPKGEQTVIGLACRALSAGCSHTVVSWLDEIDAGARMKLQAAGQSGQAQSLNVRLG